MSVKKYFNEICASAILIALGILFIWVHIITGVHLQIWLFPLIMFIVYHYFNVWKLKPRIIFGLLVILALFFIGNYVYTYSIFSAKSQWIKVTVNEEEYFVKLEPFSYSKVYNFTVWTNGSKNEPITLNIYRHDGRLYGMYNIKPEFENNKTYYRISISASLLEKGIYYFNYSFMRYSNDYRVRNYSFPGPIHMTQYELYAFICQTIVISYILLTAIYVLLIFAIHITREGGKK